MRAAATPEIMADRQPEVDSLWRRRRRRRSGRSETTRRRSTSRRHRKRKLRSRQWQVFPVRQENGASQRRRATSGDC